MVRIDGCWDRAAVHLIVSAYEDSIRTLQAFMVVAIREGQPINRQLRRELTWILWRRDQWLGRLGRLGGANVEVTKKDSKTARKSRRVRADGTGLNGAA